MGKKYIKVKSLKGKPISSEKPWTPFVRCTILVGPDGVERDIKDWKKDGRNIGTEEVYTNSRYQVFVYRKDQVPQNPHFPELIWLSIKRRDKQVIHDWRDLQRIKNELIGPNHEAVELFPSEERLVDTANQYHLWVLANSVTRFPFGWLDRETLSPEEASEAGAVQREFEENPAQPNPKFLKRVLAWFGKK